MTHWNDKELVGDAQMVIHLVSGKWILQLLAVLDQRQLRHNELHRQIDPRPRSKVFDETLRRLIELKLVVRQVDHEQNPPAVYYALSPEGRSLMPMLKTILQWVEQNRRLVEMWSGASRDPEPEGYAG